MLLTLSEESQALKITGEHSGHVHVGVGKKAAGQMCTFFKNQTNEKMQTMRGERGESSV